jgi:hypothetical protein
LRAGGEEALRAAGGATEARGGAAVVDVDVADAVRPFSTRISLLFAVDEDAEEFVFTKRCSVGS